MAAKLGDPVDPATSIHTHAGDLDRARALAQQRGVSVAQVLGDLLRDALDGIEQRGIDTTPELDLKDDAPSSFADQLAEDLVLPSVALGHVDPNDDDLGGFVANLISGDTPCDPVRQRQARPRPLLHAPWSRPTPCPTTMG